MEVSTATSPQTISTPPNTPASSWVQPPRERTIITNNKANGSSDAEVSKDNYKHIKTRYFQSLNLGKARQSSSNGSTNSNSPAKSTPTKKAPISTPFIPIPNQTHTRKRSNTQPVAFYQQPVPHNTSNQIPERKSNPLNTQNQSQNPDYFVPFAMSVPANVILSQSFAPSYIPRSSLYDSRDNLMDLDEDLVGPRESEEFDGFEFEHSQPIEIPVMDEEELQMTVAKSNFVDRDTDDFETSQRRRNAKLRSMVPIE